MRGRVKPHQAGRFRNSMARPQQVSSLSETIMPDQFRWGSGVAGEAPAGRAFCGFMPSCPASQSDVESGVAEVRGQ